MRTLLELKAVGLAYVQARCVECGTEFDIPIKALHLPADTLLSDIWVLRPIACPQCSAPALVIPPDRPANEEGASRLEGAADKDESAQ